MFHLTSRMCVLCQILKQKGAPIGWVNGFLSRDSSFPQMIRGSREKGDSICNSERVTDSHSWPKLVLLPRYLKHGKSKILALFFPINLKPSLVPGLMYLFHSLIGVSDICLTLIFPVCFPFLNENASFSQTSPQQKKVLLCGHTLFCMPAC